MQLAKYGAKPRLWFTGNVENDPILMAFESTAGDPAGKSRIAIFQYRNLGAMTDNITERELFLDRNLSTQNEGSPSWESVSFSGNILTSSFELLFAYQNSTGGINVANGVYHYTGMLGTTHDYSWTPVAQSSLNGVYQGLNYSDSFAASRQKFRWEGDDYYLVEAMRRNENSGQDQEQLLLCDASMAPLFELHMVLPLNLYGRNLTAPAIRKYDDTTFQISFENRLYGSTAGGWNDNGQTYDATASTAFVYLVEMETYVAPAPQVTTEEPEAEKSLLDHAWDVVLWVWNSVLALFGLARRRRR